MDINMIGKTELWIQSIRLHEANLSDIAGVVSEVFELSPQEVLVVDAGPTHVTLDILRQTMELHQFTAKESLLLSRLSKLPGVTIDAETAIHSEGILEMISLDPDLKEDVTAKAATVGKQMEEAFLKRVRVFPTGAEVLSRVIEDTNSPYIKEALETQGYRVTVGDILPDNVVAISNALEEALYEGYGLIITTGGVGAEGKDQTVEATLRLDATAATPWVVKYEQTGRHVKPGVRIGVGQIGKALIVNLPGPHDEVADCIPVLVSTLAQGARDKTVLAENLSAKLKSRHLPH
ncbi:MAG: competence/damage-inducible protein A [Dehalococcoidia bacterium]|nr:competence/damage-inducible protein A [Dehalococcoidia bacterium]